VSAPVEPVVVPGWPAPRGYANGMIATGRTLYVAGQIGWDAAGVFHSDDLIAQFDQALANVVAVVRPPEAPPRTIA
jgi:enamine deaminase RidA (YjgF/YER057c/UK114 family)